MSEVRVPWGSSDFLAGGNPSVRVNYGLSSPLSGGIPNVRVNYVMSSPLSGGIPNVRTNMVLIETLMSLPPEEQMSTESFPGFGNSISNPSVPAGANPFNTALPGLTFSVHKKPMFNTRISEAASGFEVRNALMAFPKWDFELTYEYLEDSTGAESSLKTIMGFFLARQGAYDTWLFKDPDDYLCVNSTCAVLDGVTATAYFCREMVGGFLEKVGQVDTANTIAVYNNISAEAHTIPVTPGPYTATVDNTTYLPIIDAGVVRVSTGLPMTKVSGAPAAGQYSVDEATGIYTFNSANQNSDVEISYGYEIDSADYTITLPNLITFDSAPPAGTITADFQFFFVCRFLEDQVDFEKFMDKLWSLQQCNFRSLIQ